MQGRLQNNFVRIAQGTGLKLEKGSSVEKPVVGITAGFAAGWSWQNGIRDGADSHRLDGIVNERKMNYRGTGRLNSLTCMKVSALSMLVFDGRTGPGNGPCCMAFFEA